MIGALTYLLYGRETSNSRKARPGATVNARHSQRGAEAARLKRGEPEVVLPSQASIAQQYGDAARREGVAGGVVLSVRRQSQRGCRAIQVSGQRRFEVGKAREVVGGTAVLAGYCKLSVAGSGSDDRGVARQRRDIDILRVHLDAVMAADAGIRDIEIQMFRIECFERSRGARIAPIDVHLGTLAAVIVVIIVVVHVALRAIREGDGVEIRRRRTERGNEANSQHRSSGSEGAQAQISRAQDVLRRVADRACCRAGAGKVEQ